jgi:hypothetical protein
MMLRSAADAMPTCMSPAPRRGFTVMSRSVNLRCMTRSVSRTTSPASQAPLALLLVRPTSSTVFTTSSRRCSSDRHRPTSCVPSSGTLPVARSRRSICRFRRMELRGLRTSWDR